MCNRPIDLLRLKYEVRLKEIENDYQIINEKYHKTKELASEIVRNVLLKEWDLINRDILHEKYYLRLMSEYDKLILEYKMLSEPRAIDSFTSGSNYWIRLSDVINTFKEKYNEDIKEVIKREKNE